MQFKKLNREGPENVYMVVQNVEGATITTGRAVSIKPTAASNDGVNAVIANAAADYPGFMGFALTDIPNNDYGRIQVSGFVNSILISNEGSSITINAGDPLVPAPAGVASAAPTYANSGFKYVITGSNQPVAVSAAAYVSGLIKML